MQQIILGLVSLLQQKRIIDRQWRGSKSNSPNDREHPSKAARLLPLARGG
jgi:hypothetical protein